MALDRTFSTIQSGLVTLGGKKPAAPFLERLRAGPVADKFFCIGALAGYLGMAGYGAHLWLAMNGQSGLPAGYGDMRQVHSSLQFFLFFAPFIVGFTIQAGPKLLGVSTPVPGFSLFILFLLLVGSIAKAVEPGSMIAGSMLCLAFVWVILFFSKTVVRNYATINTHALFFLTASQLGFCLACFAPYTVSGNALVLFWLAVVPALYAGGEQFVSSFLGGRRISGWGGVLLRFSYLLSALAAMVVLFWPSGLAWQLWTWSSLVSICVFLYSSSLWRLSSAQIRTPLGLAMCLSYLWALLGAMMLILDGMPFADLGLHTWATGWGVTAILAISSQVMGHLSGQPLYSDRTAIFVVLLWQLVPLGRGLFHWLPIGGFFSWVVLSAASVSLLIWVVQLIRAEYRIVRRQFSLRSGERLGSC